MTTLYPGCKVNLSLAVTGKLANGYHTLDSIFFPLKNPHDILHIKEAPRGDFSLHCDARLDGKNILQKTWEIFCGQTGQCPGVELTLKKGIPAGAGLGGGSSDAACLLVWLNRKITKPLSQEKLLPMAAKIGADVPFFLLNRPARALGIGEILQPLPAWPEFWLALVWPQLFLGTADIFRKMDAQDKQESGLTNFRHAAKNNFPRGLTFMDDIGRNDLEPCVTNMHPRLLQLKKSLLALGADCAAMSGGGSSFFGLFLDGGKAEAATHALAKSWAHVWLEHFPQKG